MIQLKETITEYALEKGFKMKEVNPGVFSLDIRMPLNDGTFRYQFVWIWEIAGRAKGQDCIYLNSRVGVYNPTLNLYNMVKDSGAGIYSSLTIVNDKDKEGNPCESLVVHASPIKSQLSKEQLFYIIREVAEQADIMEEIYFVVDKN